MVSVPGLTVVRLAAAHASGVDARLGAVLGAWEAWLTTLDCGDDPGQEQAPRTRARASVVKVRVDRSIAASSGLGALRARSVQLPRECTRRSPISPGAG